MGNLGSNFLSETSGEISGGILVEIPRELLVQPLRPEHSYRDHENTYDETKIRKQFFKNPLNKISSGTDRILEVNLKQIPNGTSGGIPWNTRIPEKKKLVHAS